MISNGIDIVNISRFDELKANNDFMVKVFRDEELLYIQEHNNKSVTIAGMFSAKEAFLKAIKKGITDYALTDIEIKHNEAGDPYLELHNSLTNIEYKSISISISHDTDYAIASCIILK